MEGEGLLVLSQAQMDSVGTMEPTGHQELGVTFANEGQPPPSEQHSNGASGPVDPTTETHGSAGDTRTTTSLKARKRTKTGCLSKAHSKEQTDRETDILQPVVNAASSAGRNGQRVAIASNRSATVRATRHVWSLKIHWVLSAPPEGFHSKVTAYSISMRRGRMELQGNMGVCNQHQTVRLHYLQSVPVHVHPSTMGRQSRLPWRRRPYPTRTVPMDRITIVRPIH